MTADLPGLVQQIAHFENRLAADPGSRVFLPLADLYRRAGKLEDARRILLRGLDRHRGFVTARAALGLVLTEMGDAAAARAELQKVIAVDADNVLALRLLAREAAEREAWAEACDHYERLLRLEPEDRAVRDGLRDARRQQEQAPAATPALPEPDPGPMTPRSEAVAEAPGFETPTLAELYLKQGHPQKARVILERILAAEPGREDALAVMQQVEAATTSAGAAKVEESAAAAAASAEVSAGPAEPPAPAPRGEDLDRFRAWLDAAAERPGSPN